MKLTRHTPSLSKIEEEYEGDFLKDDEKMFKIKQIIDELDDLDKVLLSMLMSNQWQKQVRNSMYQPPPYTLT